MHNVCVCAEWKLLLRRTYFAILIIYIQVITIIVMEFVCLFMTLVNYVDTCIFIIFFF